MLTFDNEEMILDCFKDVETKDIALFGNFLKCKYVHYAITGYLNKKKWINSSGKNEPPPDFYNPKLKLMMEVMRIDDHAYIDKKGRVQNKTLQHEGKLFRKINQPDRPDIKVFIVGDTKLPTKEDHNFERYYKNFVRVFKDHESKLELYKKNHPGYKTIFFICDESSAYMEAPTKELINVELHKGDISFGRPHLCCIDKKFVDIIKESTVDYVIWYTPWKLFRYVKNNKVKIFPLPKCAIYDVKNVGKKHLLEYNHDCMISVEE